MPIEYESDEAVRVRILNTAVSNYRESVRVAVQSLDGEKLDEIAKSLDVPGRRRVVTDDLSGAGVRAVLNGEVRL